MLAQVLTTVDKPSATCMLRAYFHPFIHNHPSTLCLLCIIITFQGTLTYLVLRYRNMLYIMFDYGLSICLMGSMLVHLVS